jgi:hypothetical protein
VSSVYDRVYARELPGYGTQTAPDEPDSPPCALCAEDCLRLDERGLCAKCAKDMAEVEA